VLDDEDPLEIVAGGLEQGFHKGPGAREVELDGLVVAGVEQISVVGALAGGIEGDRFAGEGRAVGVEQVKKEVDVAAGLMGAVAGDRAAFGQAELADGREAARVGAIDGGGGAQERADELDGAVTAFRALARVESEAGAA